MLFVATLSAKCYIIAKMNFIDKVKNRVVEINSLLVVGLDTASEKLPIGEDMLSFNKKIIDATQEYTVAYKSNYVFYSAEGSDGLEALRMTNRYLHQHYPGVMHIVDCKKDENLPAGIDKAKQELFDWLEVDAITSTPWMGSDTVTGFAQDPTKGVLVLCKDSNPSSVEIQDLEVNGKPMYQIAAEYVAKEWNKNGNVFIEAPLNFPEALRRIRVAVGDEMMILTLGFGSQGGKLDDLVLGLNSKKTNLLVAAAKKIIFASRGNDFAQAAAEKAKYYRDEINQIRLAA